ncbi:MAG: elongation factor 4 [Parcubacteria group bacterium]|nr:elongation factor 4 [Parcubacteria group bacterium]
MSDSNIRNFCIIAHVDHGKSTLADRLLELTGTIDKRKMHDQFLDMHPLEQERGITIKLQPVKMIYKLPKDERLKTKEEIYSGVSHLTLDVGQDSEFILNLIDTPGHVDFSYEVSRSLAAVEGAVLLVDATQGVQAQTLANFNLAKEQKLDIIPVLNKIDLPTARVQESEEQLESLLASYENVYKVDGEILKISGKLGTNVDKLLGAIIKNIRSPKTDIKIPLKALIFDSLFDPYRGVIAYVRVFEGQVKPGDSIFLSAQKTKSEVVEVGIFAPALKKEELLLAGEIGYIATGLKDISKVKVGDTITIYPQPSEFKALAGYKECQPLVFASLFPRNQDDFESTRDALNKLKLQDAALLFEPESSSGLGRGFRCGFLGLLHAEIVGERLKRDFGLDLIISTPSVQYQITLMNDERFIIHSASKLPDPSRVKFIEEPIVKLEILTPQSYVSQILDLIKEYRGQYVDSNYLAADTIILQANAPLADMIVDFYDRLKSVSSGYASLSYDLIGYKIEKLTRLDILVAGDMVEPFSRIVPEIKIHQEAKRIVEKLKQLIPPQLFEVAIQAAIGGKIIARETLRARRKDVTGYLYGGDVTRKMKLLKKQKRGKERLKESGRVNIPQEVFLEMLKR